MTLRFESAYILMNLGDGSGLNHRTPAVVAQFWDEMGSYDYI
jgi:hypothetical protein